MDRTLLETMLKMLASPNEADALMALKGIAGAFEAEGASLPQALLYAAAHVTEIKAPPPTVEHSAFAAPAPRPAAAAVTNTGGMPDCRVSGPGSLEIVLPGQSSGAVITLQGAAASETELIVAGFKDAIAAAIINKSRMKLKLLDIKDKRGDIVETVLQAEYERQGMAPVRIWANVRGEAASLASLLRKALAATLPELAAA